MDILSSYKFFQECIIKGIDIVLKLRAQYDVSEEECESSTINFLNNLVKLGFIETN